MTLTPDQATLLVRVARRENAAYSQLSRSPTGIRRLLWKASWPHAAVAMSLVDAGLLCCDEYGVYCTTPAGRAEAAVAVLEADE